MTLKGTIPICESHVLTALIIIPVILLAFVNYIIIITAIFENSWFWLVEIVVGGMTFAIINLVWGIFTGKLLVELKWKECKNETF